MPLTKVDFRIPPRAREHDWSVRWGERTRQQKADIKMRNALLQFLILVVENTRPRRGQLADEQQIAVFNFFSANAT